MQRGQYIRTEQHREESRERASKNLLFGRKLGEKHTQEAKRKMSESHKKLDYSFMIGHKLSQETKAKMSKALKGKYVGDKNPFYGRHHTEETKQKIRDNHPYINIRGENHFNWKNGISSLGEKTKTRDNFTCRVCGLRDDEIMVVDHIKPRSIYPELEYDINNLQTLCPNCHARKTNKEKIEIIKAKKYKLWELLPLNQAI